MSKAKVMVVDDSPTELKLISKSLLEVGYDVITASDGEEALQKVNSEPVATSCAGCHNAEAKWFSSVQENKIFAKIKWHQDHSVDE